MKYILKKNNFGFIFPIVNVRNISNDFSSLILVESNPELHSSEIQDSIAFLIGLLCFELDYKINYMRQNIVGDKFKHTVGSSQIIVNIQPVITHPM